MSQSKVKAYRKTIRKNVTGAHREIIFKHMDNLCAQPLRTRLHFAWFFIRGINPHTKKRG